MKTLPGSTRRARYASLALAAALAALAPAASRACGACAEDKIAATYDHAVAVRAAARGDVIVVCEVSGPFDAQRLRAAARHVPGIDTASVRVSVQPPALAFALDPRVRSPHAAVQAVQRRAPPGTRLHRLRPSSGSAS